MEVDVDDDPAGGGDGSSGRGAGPGRPRDRAIDDALIRAAQRQLAEHGYEGLSIAAVAAEANTSRQALYRRFPSKAELATAAVAAMSRAEERRDTDDPFADLVTELTAFRDGVLRPNGVSLVGTMLLTGVEPELVARYRERIVAPRRRRLRHVLERGVELGLLDADADLDLAVATCTGNLYALALAGIDVPLDWPARTATLVWRACGGRRPGGS